MNKYNIFQPMAFLLLLVVLSNTQVVNATVIDPDISIDWETIFDDGFSFGSTSGAIINKEEGAATATTTFAGSTVTGVNPLEGAATNTGDGFRIEGSGKESGIGEEFAVGIDSHMDISNASASSTFEVVLKLVHSNTVDSKGVDAFADSEFTVDLDLEPSVAGPISEMFFSDVVSDTMFGNEIGGDPTGFFGGEVSVTGTDLFTFILAPLEAISLDFIWTVEGGVFEDFVDFPEGDDGFASFDSFFDLSIVSVTDTATPPPSTVPIPGVLVLFGIGLFSLLGFTRIRKTIVA